MGKNKEERGFNELIDGISSSLLNDTKDVSNALSVVRSFAENDFSLEIREGLIEVLNEKLKNSSPEYSCKVYEEILKALEEKEDALLFSVIFNGTLSSEILEKGLKKLVSTRSDIKEILRLEKECTALEVDDYNFQVKDGILKIINDRKQKLEKAEKENQKRLARRQRQLQKGKEPESKKEFFGNVGRISLEIKKLLDLSRDENFSHDELFTSLNFLKENSRYIRHLGNPSRLINAIQYFEASGVSLEDYYDFFEEVLENNLDILTALNKRDLRIRTEGLLQSIYYLNLDQKEPFLSFIRKSETDDFKEQVTKSNSVSNREKRFRGFLNKYIANFLNEHANYDVVISYDSYFKGKVPDVFISVLKEGKEVNKFVVEYDGDSHFNYDRTWNMKTKASQNFYNSVGINCFRIPYYSLKNNRFSEDSQTTKTYFDLFLKENIVI